MSDDEATAAARAAGFIDWRARGEYWRIGVGLFLVAFTNAHSTLLSIIFARNGHDLHTIGVLLSSLAVPIIFFALMSGEFSARLGVLPTLRLSMALILVGFVSLCLVSHNFAGALVSRFVQGAGQGLFLSASITYAQSRLSPARFLFLLGVFSAAMPLAQAVAPAFGEFTLNTYGERAMFLIAGVPGLIGLALTLGVRPLPRPPQSRGLDLVASWRPQLVEPLATIVMAGAMFGFTIAYLAPALEARAVPLAAFFTASTMTMFATRALGLRSVEQADKRMLIGAGLALEALGFVAIALAARQTWLVACGGILFGFGHSMIYPVLSVWVSEGVEPSRRSGPQAWLNAFFNIGLYATPLPETWLVASFGYDWTMLFLASLCGASAGALVLRSRRPL